MALAASPRLPLLRLDPDLGAALAAEAFTDAELRIGVRVARLRSGSWSPLLNGGTSALGLLIVDGLIVREIRCGSTGSAELLGTGDLVRPWQADDDSLIDPQPAWHVAREARVAFLDEDVTPMLQKWPSIVGELFARATRRARALSIQQAIAQLRRLDERTLLYLWHVAERFGRVTPAGLAVHLPLTHERLATLVGAHRPSLTSALRGLETDGLLVRDDDQHYVLTPSGRERVRELSDAAQLAA